MAIRKPGEAALRARFMTLVYALTEAFWVLPAVIAAALAGLGALAVNLQRRDGFLELFPADWVYGGGETGARALLGAIASSTIGVAGTLFSITIAALSLASSQMGPRLLRNFVRDRGNQATLGVLLGTFSYALVVLRSVRGGGETTFVPSFGVTVGLILAALCVGFLIYFVHHVASRINVDTVIELVHADIDRDLARLPQKDAARRAQDDGVDWRGAATVSLDGAGYLQQVDAAAIVAWAEKHDTAVRLKVRRGGYVYPGAVVAEVAPPRHDAEAAIRGAFALGGQAGANDLLYSVMQLVDVAVRALSPGINDPRTAVSVLDRLGSVLCRIATRDLRGGLHGGEGRLRLVTAEADYADLVSAMFTMIRQAAGRSPAVLLHILHVLCAVARVEREPSRLETLRSLAAEVAAEGRAGFVNPFDRRALAQAHRRFLSTSAAEAA